MGRRRHTCTPWRSQHSRMGRKRSFRFVFIQNLAGRPRHVDATSKLIQPCRDGADARRFRRTRVEAPYEQDRNGNYILDSANNWMWDRPVNKTRYIWRAVESGI